MLRKNRSIRPATRFSAGPSLIAALALSALAGCAPMKQPTAADRVDTPAVAQFSSCAKPVWPAEDLRAGHDGTVTLSFLVGVEGKVRDAKIVKSSGYGAMDEAARDGIMKCEFKPATRGGQPVESWVPIQYVWTHA
jgi:bla regulator protein blaR1